MRYSISDLQCDDLMWFGIDKNGYILEFTTGGAGNVPEFVCRSKEDTEKLCDFFTEDLPKTCEASLVCAPDPANPLLEDCMELSRKGITCFDVKSDENDALEDSYQKISIPSLPLLFDNLPQDIRSIMEDFRLDIDVTNTDSVEVPHAY